MRLHSLFSLSFQLIQDCSISSRRSTRQVKQPNHYPNPHNSSVNKQISSKVLPVTGDDDFKSSSRTTSTNNLVDSISMEVITKKSSTPTISSISTTTEPPLSATSGNSKKRHRRQVHYSKAFYVNVGNFVHQLGESKKFFMAISDQICANSKHNSDKCWNGTSFSP